MNKKKILHITPNFNYSCGRSKLVYFYLKYFSNKKEYQTHFITNGGDSLDRISEIPNLSHKLLNFSTGYKNILYNGSLYRNLKKYILENEINIIHTHHRFPEIISVRISKELQVKTVSSAHSFVTGFRRSSFKSDKIISVSDYIKEFLINHYNINKEKIITLYNPIEEIRGADLALAERFKKENNISNDKKILLFIGRISKEKGVDTLLKSFLSLIEKNKNLILMINGQIEDKSILPKSILCNTSIIFIQPQKDIDHLYSIANLVVLPSREEPLGYTMLEAGVHKKPFIGGNTGGIAEFIVDGKNGLLVDPENPQELSEKIIYLLNNPDYSKKLGENLFEKVNRLCDYNDYFNKVEKIYNLLMAS